MTLQYQLTHALLLEKLNSLPTIPVTERRQVVSGFAYLVRSFK